ncbi:hypothetical protein CF327_g2202 [Tilletia walkeri]|nr:hypothetical protein CF327_g2202 [Tilletia walkeri]
MQALTAPTSLPPNSEVYLLADFCLRQISNKRQVIEAALQGANTLRTSLENPFDDLGSVVRDGNMIGQIGALTLSVSRTNAYLSTLVDILEDTSVQLDHLCAVYAETVQAIDAYALARTARKAFPKLRIVHSKPWSLSDADSHKLERWANDVRYQYDEAEVSFIVAKEKNQALREEKDVQSDTDGFDEGDLALPKARFSNSEKENVPPTSQGIAVAQTRQTSVFKKPQEQERKVPKESSCTKEGKPAPRALTLEQTKQTGRAAKARQTGTLPEERAQRKRSGERTTPAGERDHKAAGPDLKPCASDAEGSISANPFSLQSVGWLQTPNAESDSNGGEKITAQIDEDAKAKVKDDEGTEGQLTVFYESELHILEDHGTITEDPEPTGRTTSNDVPSATRNAHKAKHEGKQNGRNKDQLTVHSSVRRPLSKLPVNIAPIPHTEEKLRQESAGHTPVAVRRAPQIARILRNKENGPNIFLPRHRSEKDPARRRSDEHEEWLQNFRTGSSFAMDGGTNTSMSTHSYRTASMDFPSTSSRNNTKPRRSDEHETWLRSFRTNSRLWTDGIFSDAEAESRVTTTSRTTLLEGESGQVSVDGRQSRQASHESSTEASNSSESNISATFSRRRGTAKRDTLGHIQRILAYNGSSASADAQVNSVKSDSDEICYTPRPKAGRRGRLPSFNGGYLL